MLRLSVAQNRSPSGSLGTNGGPAQSHIAHNPGSRLWLYRSMSHEPKSALQTLVRLPWLAFAVLVVLVDDAFRAVVVPAVRALARLRVVRRIEAVVAALPAYGVLALFVVPLAIIEPLKVYGLYLFGQGRFLVGVLVFVVAKVVGLGLAERLFAIGRGKLLSIGWFAACHGRIIAVRDTVYRWLDSTEFWPRAKALVARARDGVRRTGQGLKRMLTRIGRDRGIVAAARRQLLSNRE
jgi:hypothetical protein